MFPKACYAYYYGGLPIKGTRRRGKLWVEGEALYFEAPERKGYGKIDLKIPFSRMEEIFLSRDNYYGADTALFNLAFCDQNGRPFILRFAPVTIVPRRRIALQKEWFDYLAKLIKPADKVSPLSTR
ncbi:MAG: hypothetical protein A2169_08810 [Deltaproteobacteria bacterium RBG_13_47_9]|nr:MAG: hypothetical protein A2169_08810 [Deltaproteobacteria bacterium RBG_13_47_9]